MKNDPLDELKRTTREAAMKSTGAEPVGLLRGQAQCPQCGRVYLPDLGERKRPGMMVQDEFPNPPMPAGYPSEEWRLACKQMSTKREQYLTGICSQSCWELFVGTEETEPEEDE